MERKIINLLIAIPVIIFSFLIKRNKSYFSFGEWFGKKNSDSSFYIFKEASKDKKINVAWITKSDEVYSSLKKQNYKCYKATSIEGILHQLKSWTFVSTVNSFDFFPPALIGQKNYIQLGHGWPFKKYYITKFTNFEKFRFFIRSKTVEKYSYCASPTEVFNKIIKYQYSIDDSQLIEIPPARCDFFFETKKNDILKKLNINDDKILITYLPTHRDEGNSIEIIYKNLGVIDKLIENSDYKVLFKPHFYDIEKFKNCYFNFKNILFDPEWNSDELMLVSNILIGDYSGVVFDYFHLNKPVIGFCPDYNSYIFNHRELYFKLQDVYENLAFNQDELLILLNKHKKNKLKENNSSKYVWKGSSKLSYSQYSWNQILKTVS